MRVHADTDSAAAAGGGRQAGGEAAKSRERNGISTRIVPPARPDGVRGRNDASSLIRVTPRARVSPLNESGTHARARAMSVDVLDV